MTYEADETVTKSSFPRGRESRNTAVTSLAKPVFMDRRLAEGQFILSACKAVEGRG